MKLQNPGTGFEPQPILLKLTKRLKRKEMLTVKPLVFRYVVLGNVWTEYGELSSFSLNIFYSGIINKLQ